MSLGATHESRSNTGWRPEPPAARSRPRPGGALRAKLERAADVVVQGDKPLACALLNGYIAAINLAPTSVLSPAEKAELRDDANRIKAALGC
jgi:hypothetical protein